jgi:hypothetical protein
MDNEVFTLRLDIDPQQFRTDLRNRILRSPMRSLPELIIDLVIGQFDRKLKNLVESGRILRYRIGFNSREGISPIRTWSTDWHPPSARWPDRPSTIQLPWFLNSLTNDSVMELGWFGFTIVSRIPDSRPIHFEEPVNLISSRPLEIKEKPLKTVCHYMVRMGYWEPVCLPVQILAPIRDELVPSCECHSDYLAAYIEGVWDWALRFICKICGKSYYCDCFRPALERHYLEALELKSHHTESGWPHRFVAAYEKSQFRGNICHLCRGIPSELYYCHPMYGSTVKVHYGPYIRKLAIEKNIEESEAENGIRDVLGIPHIGEGWVSERELLNMVKDIFPKNEIIHQASPEWLGRQRLDIFIPELGLGIEYQGRQHYDAVPFFGGEEGLQKTRERDESKARLCSENGVALVMFRYDETLKKELVKARIERALESRLVKRPENGS